MIEEDAGGGGGNNKNNADMADDYDDDDDHEPCSKKVMPALFAWFLLISTSSSYFTLVLPEFINLIGLDQIYLFISIVGVHAFIFLYVILNFSIATFMDPGRFPKVDLKEAIEEDGIHHSGTYKNVLINDINVRMKWCTTCQFYRPPRSSHCGVCNACIDTMDHHCPWVCNCIARRNYKYFLQFLISLSIHMLSIFGLCLTLVMYNKENLTHIPIIIAILLIVIVGILIIPIGGLTGFHIVLVSRGRTTNEQVTGKFRTGVNPFDNGCWNNWKQIIFISTVPSYIQFKRKRLKQKEYLETKLNLIKYQNAKTSTTVHTNKYFQNNNENLNGIGKKTSKKIYTNHENINVSSEKVAKNNDILISIENNNNNKKYKNDPTVIDVQNELQLKSLKLNNRKTNPNNNYQSNNTNNQKKVAKVSKHLYNYQHGHKIASNRFHDDDDIEEDEEEDLEDLEEYQIEENQYDNNDIIYKNYPNTNASTNGTVLNHKQIKQQQLLLEQQLFNQKQKQQLSNVWIDRKTNKIILSSDTDEINKVKKQFRKHDNNNNMNKNAIDKLMSNERKLQQQQLLMSNDCPSSSIDSSSSRCIRNNSYLNANHNVNIVPNNKNSLYAGGNNSNSMSNSIDTVRPPSSASNSSSVNNYNNNNGSVHSNLIKQSGNKKKRKAQSNHNKNKQYQLEQEKFQLDIIDEKMAKANQDYASYEITV